MSSFTWAQREPFLFLCDPCCRLRQASRELLRQARDGGQRGTRMGAEGESVHFLCVCWRVKPKALEGFLSSVSASLSSAATKPTSPCPAALRATSTHRLTSSLLKSPCPFLP